MSKSRWTKFVLAAAAGSVLGAILAAAWPTEYVADGALAMYSSANDVEHCAQRAVDYCTSFSVLTNLIRLEDLYATERAHMSDSDAVYRVRKDLQFGVLSRNGTINELQVAFAYSDQSTADRVLKTVVKDLEAHIHSCTSDKTGTPVAVEITEPARASPGGARPGLVAAIRIHAPGGANPIPLRAELKKAVLDQSRLERVVVRQGLAGNVHDAKSIEDAAKRLRRSLVLKDDPQWPGTLWVRYEDKQPERAMRTVAWVMTAVVDDNFRSRDRGETASIVWLINGMSSARPQSRFGIIPCALLGGAAGLVVALASVHVRRPHRYLLRRAYGLASPCGATLRHER